MKIVTSKKDWDTAVTIFVAVMIAWASLYLVDPDFALTDWRWWCVMIGFNIVFCALKSRREAHNE